MAGFGFRRNTQLLGLSAIFATLILSASSCGGDATSIGKMRPVPDDASAGSSDGNIGAGGDGGSGFDGTGGASGSGPGGDGGTGGSGAGAGTSGSGGSAGSGAAAGSAGSSGSAGAAGSSGSAAAAGSGGIKGGGGYGGAVVDGFAEKFDAACAAMVQSPCVNLPGCAPDGGVPCPLGLCRAQYMSSVLAAILNGCLEEMAAQFDCTRLNPATLCGMGNECDRTSTAVSDCNFTARGCVVSIVGETCVALCQGTYPYPGAYCEPATGGVHCLCTAGPKAGHEFTTAARCGTPQWAAEVGNECF
jgi:hypothetical protein